MKEIDRLNLPLLKAESIEYNKLKKKIINAFSTDDLIKELKKRKILSIEWNEKKKKNILKQK